MQTFDPPLVHGASPQAGGEYANRKNLRPGMAEAIVDILADHGVLIWGGTWRNPLDYQHFQVSRDVAAELARSSPSKAKLLFDQRVEGYQSCIKVLPVGASRKSCIGDTRP
jgi:hypothetical protein